MKEPEMLQTIVIHHCLFYEIVFQVIQKTFQVIEKTEKLTTPISIMAAKYGEILLFYLKNYY